MNKLQKLIAKLCLDGTEYKSLGDLLDYEQPTKYIVRSTEYDDSYSTPVLTAGQTFILGYTDEKDGHYKASKESPVIIFDDFTTATQWVDFEFKVKSSAMKILTIHDAKIADIRFVYYAIQCIKYTPGEHSRHWIEKYSKFEIPLPPLAVQKEIVRMLDGMTGLISELEQELAARKQQYEWYRDKLLKMTNGGGYKRLTLGELGEFYSGLSGKSKSDFENGNARFISYMNVFTNAAVDLTRSDWVRVSADEKQNAIQYADVIFTGSSETLDECGMSSVVTAHVEEKIYLNSFCFGFRFFDKKLFDPEFLKYLLRSSDVRKQIRKTGSGVTRFNVSKARMEKVELSIPPLSEQKKIAAMLDGFDKLCNSMTDGLPGEIALRKQQYEFYRDQLLTFKKAG